MKNPSGVASERVSENVLIRTGNLRAKPLIVNRFKVFKGSANRGFCTRLAVSMPSDAEYNLSVA